jgi:hypothetical protein
MPDLQCAAKLQAFPIVFWEKQKKKKRKSCVGTLKISMMVGMHIVSDRSNW